MSDQDAERAVTVFGPDMGDLKGKITRRWPLKVMDPIIVPIPAMIRVSMPNLVLCPDIFYIDGIVFCLTISRHIGYICVHFINNRDHTTILPCIYADVTLYRTRNLTVAHDGKRRSETIWGQGSRGSSERMDTIR